MKEYIIEVACDYQLVEYSIIAMDVDDAIEIAIEKFEKAHGEHNYVDVLGESEVK